MYRVCLKSNSLAGPLGKVAKTLPISDKIATGEERIQLITSTSNHHHASKTQSVSQKRLLKDKKRISTDASKTSTNISLHLLLPQNGFRNIQAALCFQELKL